MNFKEIQELIKLINKSNITEFQMKEGDLKLSIRTKKYHKGSNVAPMMAAPTMAMPTMAAPVQQSAPAPVAESAPAPAAEAPATDSTAGYIEVKSPIVGTFYRSASPDNPPFKKVGDSIAVGDVVCIVEAMKLFNEIESEVSGKIVKVLIEDASPVEYDQPLFLVDPKG